MAASAKSKRAKLLAKRFNAKERASFYTDAAKFMQDNIKVRDMLADLSSNCKLSKSKRRRRLAEVFDYISDNLAREGSTFAEAMAKVIPPDEAMIVLSGEKAESLVEALGHLSTMIERKIAAKVKLQGAAMGAVGYLLLASVFIIYIAIKIIPNIANAAPVAVLRTMHFAPFYFAFCEGYLFWSPFIAVFLILAAIFIARTLPRWTGPKRRWFDEHVPPWTIYHRMQATMFLITASIMIRANTRLKDVMTETSRLGTPWFRWQARRVMAILAGGSSEVGALQSGILPTDTMERLRIYSRLSDFTLVMQRLSDDNFNLYMRKLGAIGNIFGWISKLFFVSVIMGLTVSIMDFMVAMQKMAKF